jgi:hypothetical protein
MLGAFDSGSLEETSASVLDAALDKFIVATAVATSNLPVDAPRSAARRAAGAAAVNLAKAARGIDDDINAKISTAIAAGYSASFFGLPQNTLLNTADQVCGMFALTANQRRALHQQATAILQNYVSTKGNAMSGILQNGSFRSGSLGVLTQQGATSDGVLGAIVAQQRAFNEGSLGRIVAQQRAFNEGSLGLTADQVHLAAQQARRYRARPRYPISGLGDARTSMARRFALPRVVTTSAPGTRRARSIAGLGGCGCSGMGADAAVAPETGTQSGTPLLIGWATIVVGIVLYAVTRPRSAT